jgi:uncharacterized protein
MKTFVSGGLGFVGKHICRSLLEKGHHIVTTGTRNNPGDIFHENFEYIRADTTQPGDWQQAIINSDAAINLAGRTIFKRWNNHYKQQLRDSRLLTTRHIVAAIPKDKPFVLCSTSAVGYYGNRGDDILIEQEAGADDFLGQLSRDWEKEALAAEGKGARVAIARFGIVLGRDGGALSKMIPAFKSFVGGPLGNGQQWFPWIHIKDVVGAIEFILASPDVNGVFNFSGPVPVRNQELGATLGRVLGRPAIIPAPAFMIRMVMGELGDTLLSSQRAIPHHLLEAGYKFQYSDLEAALKNLCNA